MSDSRPPTLAERGGPASVPPAGCRLEPAGDLKTRSAGRILIGGSPLTITRLSSTGADLVRGWFGGTPIGDDPKHHALARRLTGAGMANLRLPEQPTAEPEPIAVIIPVKDDRDGLTATLDRLLGPDGPGAALTIIVVDDGSATPVSVDDRPVTVIRRPVAGGPGPARQTGLAACHGPTVAFVDAGVLISADHLTRLAGSLTDPDVVAAAPRVRSIDGDHPVARFDATRSPLDLGPVEGLVGPGRRVPYVPTACLVVRRDAVDRAGGFDPGLRHGEDVDLVWRLAAAGQVRYRPDIEAWHPPRRSLRAMIAQRRGYASAAAPLARRHGSAVAPARVSPWSLLVLGLAVAGRPLAAAAAVVGTGLALRPKIRPLPDLTVEAMLLTARGHWYAGLSVLTAATRAWTPLLAAAALVLPSQRRRLATVVGAALGRRILDGPRKPGPAARDLGMGAIDDLAYCAGVWTGVVRERDTGALAIDLTSWPKPKSKPPKTPTRR